METNNSARMPHWEPDVIILSLPTLPQQLSKVLLHVLPPAHRNAQPQSDVTLGQPSSHPKTRLSARNRASSAVTVESRQRLVPLHQVNHYLIAQVVGFEDIAFFSHDSSTRTPPKIPESKSRWSDGPIVFFSPRSTARPPRPSIRNTWMRLGFRSIWEKRCRRAQLSRTSKHRGLGGRNIPITSPLPREFLTPVSA
jgi:hypothetical protein